MKTTIISIVTVAAMAHCIVTAQEQVKPSLSPRLTFTAAGTNGFAFDTGVLKGKLRAGGKSTGLSSVVHIPTGMRLDSSMGLFGHYRVFSTNKRYSDAAWYWPSEAQLHPDGSVEAHWPSTADRPFELRAVYRWVTPSTLDLETIVLAKTNLPHFESFLGSYFTDGFTNASVCVRSNGQMCFLRADPSAGRWQAFPRDAEAASIIQDGRWKYPPSPVEWVIRPTLANPLGTRCCPANGLAAVLRAPPDDCFAILTPMETDPHRSMYLSLFGKDLKAGEMARARSRLFLGTNFSAVAPEKTYKFLPRQAR